MNEYKDFIDMMEKGELYEKDVYNEILTKEKSYLSDMNTFFNNKYKTINESKSFTMLSVSEHYFKFMRSIKNIINEIISSKSVYELPWIILYGERKIYIGVLLVLLSIFLFFVTISN
jgi:hypothetical protein